MAVLVTWFLGCVILVMESVGLSALGVESWTLQTGILLTVYVGLRREFVVGAATLSALLLPIEWLVAGPPGYYSLGLVVVFFALRMLHGNIQGGWGVTQAIIAGVAALLHAGVMVVVLLLSHPGSEMLSSVLWGMLPAAMIAAVGVVPLGRLLERVDRVLDPRRGRKVLEF